MNMNKLYIPIINLVENFNTNIPYNRSKILGVIMVALHYIFVGSWFIYFMIGPITKTYYILLFIFWFLIFFLHYLFDGCILIRIERILLHSKTYGGAWEILYYFLINTNLDKHIINNRKKNIQICGIACIILIIFLRIIFDMK